MNEIRESGLEIHLEDVILQVRVILIKYSLDGILKEKGGKYILDKPWACRWLERHDFTLRCGTQAKEKKELTSEIKLDFLYRIALAIKDHKIPKILCVNGDETGLNLCPSSKRTFSQRGSIQVPISAFGDKRQITAFLLVNVLGEKLPGQLIFKGKTNASLPKVTPPKGWIFSKNEKNHWQNVETTIEVLINVIFPFFTKKRKEMGFSDNQHALLIWDIWYSHIDEKVRELCKQNFVTMIIVPPGYTGYLQILDLVGNHPFKSYYKKEFRKWCTEMILLENASGVSAAQAKINLSLTSIKPQVPVWAATAWDNINEEIFKNGWNSIDIHQCWTSQFQEEAELSRDRLYSVIVANESNAQKQPSFESASESECSWDGNGNEETISDEDSFAIITPTPNIRGCLAGCKCESSRITKCGCELKAPLGVPKIAHVIKLNVVQNCPQLVFQHSL